jgi:addiction module HigA family antidote
MRGVVSQPGESLRETLEERGLRQSDLVRATGFTAKHVNQVIQGHAALTPNFALTLEESLGKPRAEFWCALQTQYDLAILRAATLESDRA